MKDLKLAASEMATKWCEEDNQPASYQHTYGGFLAGAQFVLDQAVEGFEEWTFKYWHGCANDREAYQAAKLSSMKEIELRDSWVKHHQKTVEIKCAQLANLQAERKELVELILECDQELIRLTTTPRGKENWKLPCDLIEKLTPLIEKLKAEK